MSAPLNAVMTMAITSTILALGVQQRDVTTVYDKFIELHSGASLRDVTPEVFLNQVLEAVKQCQLQ